MKRGKLRVVTGPMFAGKTTYIINELEKFTSDVKPLVIRPVIDNRYGDKAIYSHNGLNYPATLVDTHSESSLGDVKIEVDMPVVVVDEGMFFSQDLVVFVVRVLDMGVDVIVAGLDTDYRREPFGMMPKLMEMADDVVRLTSKCYECDGEARWTVRLNGNIEVEQVGTASDYQPACDEHYSLYKAE